MTILNADINIILNMNMERRAVNMSEVSRIILALRAAGWDDKTITNFIMWVGTGEEKYEPTKQNK